MDYNEFAQTVKTKYPEYKDVDNRQLAETVVAKYPEYKDVVQFDAPETEAPGTLKSAALGAMSGIPGATAAVSGIEALGDKTYEEAHKSLEDLKDKAWEAHPVAYGGGKTAGMIGTALAAPISIPGAVAVGGLAGLDAASKISDIPEEAAKGAAVGGVLGAAGKYVVEPVVGALSKAIPSVAKGAVASLGSKTTREGVEQYLENPAAINTALTPVEMGEHLAQSTRGLEKAASGLSEEARGALNPSVEKAINIRDVKNSVMDAANKYFVDGKIATAADETSVKTLIDQYQKLADIAESNNGTVPEPVLRQMIDRLQAATKENTYGNPEASASQQALKTLSGKLNDMLRKSNPEYAGSMAPSAEMTKLAVEAKDQFRLAPNSMGELAPTDATATKLGNVLKEGKTEGMDVLDRIKNATGEDLAQMIKSANTKASFDAPGSGEGLKNVFTALGFGAGKMTGIPYGGIGGAAAGRYAAYGMNGGQIAKKILDLYMSGTNSTVAPLIAKFGPVLVNAAKVGGNQLAATHFVLSTSNPEYQKLVEHTQNATDDTANTGIRMQE